MIIDAHQHFWQVERGDYGWLTPDLEPLYRDFMPNDLMPHLHQLGVDGTILVQAAPTTAETKFLLDIAENTPFVLGVVGWTDFAAATVADDIAQFASHPKLVGLRPMIQDIADDDWMLCPHLTPAFEAMIKADLTFDALVFPRHLPKLRQLLSRHPNLRTVIDHAGKPEISHRRFDDWASDIAIIAEESSAFCKFSGLLTEAGNDWTKPDIAPYITHVLDHFGPERLVWGSDWPVLNLAADYREWMELAQNMIPNGSEKDSVFGLNAVELYRLPKR